MRFTFSLAVGLMFLGCSDGSQDPPANAKSEIKQTRNDPSRQINLEPSDLEKLATWDDLSQASAIVITQLTDVMAEIKDADSAKAAVPKLKALARKTAALAKVQESLAEPAPEELAVLRKNLAVAESRFAELSESLAEDPEIDAIVGDLIFEVYTGHSMDEFEVDE